MIDACPGFHISDAVAFFPMDFKILDYGNADSRHIQVLQELINRFLTETFFARRLPAGTAGLPNDD